MNFVIDYKHIGIVIPTFGREDDRDPVRALEIQLYSLYRQTLQPHEIVIVDDGSLGKISKRIRALARDYKTAYVYHAWPHKQYRLAQAFNLGACVLTVPIVMFSLDDYLYPPRTLEYVSQLHEKYYNLVACFYRHELRLDWKKGGVIDLFPGAYQDFWMNNAEAWKVEEEHLSSFEDIKFSPYGFGWFSMRAEHFLAWENRFVGWGWDDGDISHAWRKFGLFPAVFKELPCFHLGVEMAKGTGDGGSATNAFYTFKWSDDENPVPRLIEDV